MFGGTEIALWTLLLAAAASDLLWGKIYNWLTFPFLFIGIAARFSGGGWNSGSQAVLAVGVAFALFFPLYAVKAVAAGDAKLLMAVGAWTDTKVIFQMAGLSILVGAVVGLISLLHEKGWRGSARSIAENIRQKEPTKTALKMPLGPAFFCAYLVVSVARHRNWELL